LTDLGDIKGLPGEGGPGVETPFEAAGAGGEAPGHGQAADQRSGDGNDGRVGGMGDQVGSEELVQPLLPVLHRRPLGLPEVGAQLGVGPGGHPQLHLDSERRARHHRAEGPARPVDGVEVGGGFGQRLPAGDVVQPHELGDRRGHQLGPGREVME
jgi:hypothetical protein